MNKKFSVPFDVVFVIVGVSSIAMICLWFFVINPLLDSAENKDKMKSAVIKTVSLNDNLLEAGEEVYTSNGKYTNNIAVLEAKNPSLGEDLIDDQFRTDIIANKESLVTNVESLTSQDTSGNFDDSPPSLPRPRLVSLSIDGETVNQTCFNTGTCEFNTLNVLAEAAARAQVDAYKKTGKYLESKETLAKASPSLNLDFQELSEIKAQIDSSANSLILEYSAENSDYTLFGEKSEPRNYIRILLEKDRVVSTNCLGEMICPDQNEIIQS